MSARLCAQTSPPGWPGPWLPLDRSPSVGPGTLWAVGRFLAPDPLPSIQSKESSTKDLATTGAPSKPQGAAPSGEVSSVWDATTHAISSHPTVGLWVIQLLLQFCRIHSALRAGWPVWWVSRKCGLGSTSVWGSRRAYSHPRCQGKFSPIIIFSLISSALSWRGKAQRNTERGSQLGSWFWFCCSGTVTWIHFYLSRTGFPHQYNKIYIFLSLWWCSILSWEVYHKLKIL